MTETFSERELKEKGAKRAVLEYISSQDPSIPIPKTVDLENREGIIIRSDHWREFDSFYGIFDSVVLHKRYEGRFGEGYDLSPNLGQAKNIIHMEGDFSDEDLISTLKRNRKLFEYYCNRRNLNHQLVLNELKTFPQEYIYSEKKGTIFQNPNVRDRYFIFIEKSGKGIHEALIFDIHDSELLPKKAFKASTYEISSSELRDITPSESKEAADIYRSIVSMEKFNDGHVYMMEFTLNPTFVLQLRRFRKFEDGEGRECIWKDEERVLRTDLSIGLTQKEGLVLPFIPIQYWALIYNYPNEFTQRIHDFNDKNKQGFAGSDSYGHYLTTFFPNLKAVLGIDPAKMANHGNLETLSTVPLFLFQMKRILRKNIPDFEDRLIDGKSSLKVFSNGREGLVKLLEESQ